MTPECIYRLAVVTIYERGHYYVYAVRNGVWVKFDDLQQYTSPVAHHPQEAMEKAGRLPVSLQATAYTRSIKLTPLQYYVIYEKIPKATVLPRNGVGSAWTTGFTLHNPSAYIEPPGRHDYTAQWKNTERHLCANAGSSGCTESFATLDDMKVHASTCITEVSTPDSPG